MYLCIKCTGGGKEAFHRGKALVKGLITGRNTVTMYQLSFISSYILKVSTIHRLHIHSHTYWGPFAEPKEGHYLGV